MTAIVYNGIVPCFLPLIFDRSRGARPALTSCFGLDRDPERSLGDRSLLPYKMRARNFLLTRFPQIFHTFLQASVLTWLSISILRTVVYTEVEGKYDVRGVLDLTHRAVSRDFVAIIICIKSVDTWSTVDDASLKTILLPSLSATVSQVEWDKYRVEVLLAYDTGDAFWEERANRRALVTGERFPISFVSVLKVRNNHIPFNEIANVAYAYGADYFVRINDDTEFVSKGWISMGVQALLELSPPFVGVVGPVCDKSPPNILTHDMVHRSHMKIFNSYYPNDFDNWWIDDWISTVYRPNRTVRISGWQVKHHINKHGTRYEHDDALKAKLPELVKAGTRRVDTYLQSWTPSELSSKAASSPSSLCSLEILEIKEGVLKDFVRCE